MTGDTVGKISADYRKRRVRRIKRIIIFLCVFFVLLPTFLSVYLIFRVNSLEEQISTLQSEKNEQEAVSGSAAEAEIPLPVTTVTLETPDGTPEPVSPEEESEKKVYLTFDDGPGPNTKKILDILKKNNVKATFFVTGKTDDFSKEMYKRIVEEGHTLGMHSYSHVYDEIYSSTTAFRRDLDKIYDYLYEVTGEYSKFYRFPGGSSVQETEVPIEKLIEILEEKDITYLDWNVLSPDIRDSGVRKKQMIRELMNDIEKYDTSVVMFYDTQTQPMTIKALPSVIKALKDKEYEILPVDENTAPIRHNQ